MSKNIFSNSLKFFLVFLVLFGMIGSVFAGFGCEGSNCKNSISGSSQSTTNVQDDPYKKSPVRVNFDTKVINGATHNYFIIESYSDYVKFMEYVQKGTITSVQVASTEGNGELIQTILDSKSLESDEYLTQKNNCISNPLSCTSLQQSAFISNGITPNPTGYSSIITQLSTNEERLKILNSNPILSDSEKTEKKNLENQNKELYSMYINKMSATEILSLPVDKRDAAIKAMNDKQCSGIMGTIGCSLGGKITTEKKVTEVVTNIMYEMTIECKTNEKCKTITGYNEILNEKFARDKIKINSNCVDTDDSGFCAKQNEEINKILEDRRKKATQVETNILYDILSAIVNPDPNAIKAAKLLGFEANYNNVPAFLRDSIPSQICMAKIDGYLDKQVSNTVNGQGGVTSYGCSQEYVQVFNEQTKKYEKQPSTLCLEVLADLRAQRTQVTPDGKTAISFSYYIKAPPNTEIKYIVAVSYRANGLIKKQEIVPLTTTTGVKNGFDSVDLNLNLTSLDSIDENSFTINLLAIYSNNGVYQKISYPILPVSYGDIYSAPIPAQVSASSSGGSSSSSQGGSSAELSTQDMLDMI